MLPKFVLVLGPLGLYGLVCLILALRGRMPSRMALNVHISLLLMAYLLGTAGLGIFWVANQQLPVFDWHYLFGYATLLLLALHLVFNLPIVVRWLSRRRTAVTSAQTGKGATALGPIALIGLLLALAFYVGKRQGSNELPLTSAAAAQDHPVARYHAFSSESRASVFQRAPGVAWGDAPPAFKTYPQAPKIALVKGGADAITLDQALAGPVSVRPVDLSGLGQLLYLSSGITLQRGGHALRAAPSSGALFPSELYVLARRVAGLAPGLYHYDPQQHRLDALGPLPAASGAAASDEADATVVLSAVFRRTGYKYHNRAYRYALADAGHLLENMRLAANAGGMQPRLLPRFDDAVAARAVRIDGIEESVLAMMTLGGPAAGSVAPVACESGHCAGDEYVPLVPAAGTSIGVTGVVHQATSLQAAPAAIRSVLPLPPPAAAAKPLYTTIVQRRSERRFAAQALRLDQLAGVLAGLYQQPQLFSGIRATVVVNRVSGIAPGVYRYLPQHALRLVRAGEQAGRALSAALSQDVIGDAAAVLILSAERERVLAPGARGYRHALIETGLIGERWLLAAAARGLAACPVGAFYDDEAAALIGVDARDHWVFHFAALGVRAR